MRLADVVGAILGKKDIKAQTTGPVWTGKAAQPMYAPCLPCTEQVRENHKRAGLKYKGAVAWKANDLERHLREFHRVGGVA